MKEKIPETLLHQANDEDYQRRFRYREAPRPSADWNTITTGQLGHMIETLNDALIFMNRLGDKPHIDVSKDPAYESIQPSRPECASPAYLCAVASDPRNASSYARSDFGRALIAKASPDIAAFSNYVHGALRHQSLKLGESFQLPAELAAASAGYEQAIEAYVVLLDKHKGAGKRDYERIPPEEMAAYAVQYNKAADKLFAALEALPEATVTVDGMRHTLPNAALVNDRLPKSCPANVLYAYRTLGKGAADRNKRPGELEFSQRHKDMVGAESLISDTAQFLMERAAAKGDRGKGFSFNCDFDRPEVARRAKAYVRSFQLVLGFCRTANCGYTQLYEDLERFIRMSDPAVEPELQELRSPQEAAMMLYAMERRLARESLEPGLQRKLRAFADKAGAANTMEGLASQLHATAEYRDTLEQLRNAARRHELGHVTPMLDLLENLQRTAIPMSEMHRAEAPKPSANGK